MPLLNWIVGVDRGSITTVICAAALLASGCGGGPKRAPAIAEAYVGPATLKIRSDLPLQSSTVGVVKHGDRLEIVQRRRKFLKVRTPAGSEGWTEENQLLAHCAAGVGLAAAVAQPDTVISCHSPPLRLRLLPKAWPGAVSPT